MVGCGKSFGYTKMNFDGTFPEQRACPEKQRMVEEEIQQSRPPVRVTVSYPLSQEWNGKPPQKWKNYMLWMTLIIILLTTAFGVYYLFTHFFDPIVEKKTNNDVLKTPMNMSELIQDQILKQFNGKTSNYDIEQQLKFYQNQYKKMANPDFLKDFGIPFHILNANETETIKQTITEYLSDRTKCLKNLAEEEQRLSSYLHHNKKQSTIDDLELSCSDAEKNLLDQIRKEYNTEPIIEKNDDTLIIQGKVIVLKKVKQLIETEPTINKIAVIASILYLDTDIAKNIDIAIFANRWEFITNSVEFNLNGSNASDPNLGAVDGKPGLSGSDGGYFLAVGFENLENEKLIVYSRGGDASPGHDGPNGKNGVPNLIPKIIGEGHKNCIVSIGNKTKNPAGEDIEMYAIFDERACAERGGSGGPAGIPGRGGRQIIIQPHKEIISIGYDGTVAKNGQNGKNGKTITGNCFYRGYKYYRLQHSVEIAPSWAPISLPSCFKDNSYELPMIPNRKIINTENLQPKPHKNQTIFHPLLTAFANIARKNFNNQQLFALLKLTESSVLLQTATPIADLYTTFDQLDRTYTNIEIFQSFAKKVKQIRQENRDENLIYLEATILSKILALNTQFGAHYVVDIENYLKDTLQFIEFFKIDKISEKPENPILKKFNEMMELLENLSKPPNGVDETDKQVVELTIKILPIFVKILRNFTSNLEISLTELNKTLIQESKTINCYRNTFLDEYQNCTLTSNQEMKLSLLKSFKKIKPTDLLNGIRGSLEAIQNELLFSFGSTKIGKKWVMDVRAAVDDLSSLLTRIPQIMREQEIENILTRLKINPKPKLLINMEKRIIQNLLYARYQKAIDAYKQYAFPYWDSIETLNPNATKDELIHAIHTIINKLKQDRTTIQPKDGHAIEAKFQKRKPIPPFFTWTNKENRYVIRELLSGRKIHLRANLANSEHGLPKQAVKLHTAEITFDIPTTILKNFKIHLTHSGFSHYFYNGTYTTILGPKMDIIHGFDFDRNGNPTVFNDVYKKIKNGDPFLSPFTTWTVQLQTINRFAKFEDFQPYLSTNVYLIGEGRYISL